MQPRSRKLKRFQRLSLQKASEAKLRSPQKAPGQQAKLRLSWSQLNPKGPRGPALRGPKPPVRKAAEGALEELLSAGFPKARAEAALAASARAEIPRNEVG